MAQQCGPNNTLQKKTPAHRLSTVSTVSTESTNTRRPSEYQELKEIFSLVSTSEDVVKPIATCLKVVLALPLVFLGCPWLYVAAYFVESKEAPDYSWPEVAWRSLGGVGFWVNGIVLFVLLKDLVGSEWKGPLTGLMGYCLGMGVLIVVQAFYGRWHEEKAPGKGHECAKLFWKQVISLFGIQTEEVVETPTTYMWAFSLFAIMSSLTCFSIVEVYSGTGDAWHSVAGQCEYSNAAALSSPTCSFGGGVEEPSLCGPGFVYAMVGENCLCCKLMVNTASFYDTVVAMGGSVVFYYGILKVFAAFCIWAEEKAIDTTPGEAAHVSEPDATKDPDGICGTLHLGGAGFESHA